MSEIKLLGYFDEHVYYELLMLNYARQCLEGATDQLVWNVMFAAFNVSARNLENFLTNKGDRTHMRVLDYKDYRTDTHSISNEPIRETVKMLNAQCLHLGKERFTEADKKINLDRIAKVSAWVVSKMDELLKGFKGDFRAKLKSDWTSILAQHKVVGVVGPPKIPTSSSFSSILATGPTGVGHAIEFYSTPKKQQRRC
jgi:hypothetical protein